jgi:LuxR family maltose regulon positive regulatory protein
MADIEPSAPSRGTLADPLPLLATKLRVPRVRAGLVRRPHLLDLLCRSFDRPVTLISAPAGFGKSMLLAHWIAECRTLPAEGMLSQASPLPCAPRWCWLALDDDDNDPVRFWRYAVAAFNAVAPGAGEEARSLLRSTAQTASGQSGPAWLQAVATSLINDLADPQGAESEASGAPVVLVLDDYHTIRSRAIHDSVAFFVEHLPANVHLVILSRADPPLPLARLRVRDQLIEIRAADLRFRPDEAEVFLNQVMQLALPAEAVESLAARTEGWAAGLHLAALSLQGRDARYQERFIQDFRGTQHHILGYLVEEVLARQPAEVQDFLLHTSMLDYLTAPLCDGVLHPVGPAGAPGGSRRIGQQSCQAMLNRLERENLFIVPLDEERRWYRYHPLFAEAMRGRLAETEPTLFAELHRRAAAWYEANGQMTDAIRHLLQIGDQIDAARLIEQGYMRQIVIGELGTLRTWLDALSLDLVRVRPRLALAYCWSIAYSGPHSLQEQLLGWVEAALGGASWDASASEEELMAWSEDPGARSIRGELLALRGLILSFRWESRRATECSQQAMFLLWPDRWAEFYQEPQGAQLATEDLWLRIVILQSLGNAYRLDGNVRSAETAYREAYRLTMGEGPDGDPLFPMLALAAASRLGQVLMAQGQPHEAEWVFERALDRVRRRGGEMQAFGGEALICLGEALLGQNRLEEAERTIREGLILSRQAANPLGEIAGHVALAQVAWAKGDADDARAEVLLAEGIAVRGQHAHVTSWVAAHRARLDLLATDLATAARWAEGLRNERGARTDFPRSIEEFEDLLVAGVHLAQGRLAEAQEIVRRIVHAAESAGRIAAVVEALTLQAAASAAEGDSAQACETLRHALTLAEPAGYVRVFLDRGETLRGVMVACRLRNGSTLPAPVRAYLDRLLAAFPSPEGNGQQPGMPAARLHLASLMIEPLTTRELEILALLARGASNQEIADQLFLSVGTVKGHINHILGKLGAHNRTEAAAFGRELGLITT